MPLVEAAILINTKPEVVRQFFLNYHNHQHWNPFIISINKWTNKESKELNIDDELQIDLRLKGTDNISTFYPRVLENNESEIQWIGCLINSWIFYGLHTFKFEIVDDDKTLFSQVEIFGGLLSYFFYLFGLYNKTRQSFIEMNEALKDQIENKLAE
ncbi:unnamed protein product [Candida verbasci]|uniref:SRPBCC domain-containing protein n=1 Tax=Candida verbasci TaxID=1227364 RepID=A0A9W4TW15_9ASCO|nr:unnamed protein product [Candida verbasci]